MAGVPDSTKEARRKEWREYMEAMARQRLAQRRYRTQNMFRGATMEDVIGRLRSQGARKFNPNNYSMIDFNFEGGGRGGPGGRRFRPAIPSTERGWKPPIGSFDGPGGENPYPPRKPPPRRRR